MICPRCETELEGLDTDKTAGVVTETLECWNDDCEIVSVSVAI